MIFSIDENKCKRYFLNSNFSVIKYRFLYDIEIFLIFPVYWIMNFFKKYWKIIFQSEWHEKDWCLIVFIYVFSYLNEYESFYFNIIKHSYFQYYLFHLIIFVGINFHIINIIFYI